MGAENKGWLPGTGPVEKQVDRPVTYLMALNQAATERKQLPEPFRQ